MTRYYNNYQLPSTYVAKKPMYLTMRFDNTTVEQINSLITVLFRVNSYLPVLKIPKYEYLILIHTSQY